MSDKTARERSDKSSPDRKVDDRGLVQPDQPSTTDEAPDSALGGKSATRSGTKSPPDPAEQRSS